MKAFIIARYTFKELLKSKLLWNVVALGVIISIVSWIAAEFTFGVPGRVALDVGLSLLSISGYFIAIFVGTTLISRELESRTIYMIISRPVSRQEFLIGKLIGLGLFLALNFILLSAFSLGVSLLLGVSLNSLIMWSVVAAYVESLLLMLVVVCISLEANVVITIMSSLTLLVAGHAVGETLQALFVKNNYYLEQFLKLYHWIFPGFYKFNLKELVIYQQTVPTGWVISSLGYGVAYTVFLVFISLWLIKRKDLN